MTQLQAICEIDAHQETLEDGNFINWPASNLTITPGDWILCYRGIGPLVSGQMVIPSSDNTYNIIFGSFWNGNYGAGSGFTGGNAGSFTINGLTQFYNGPYCSVPPNSVNLHDEMFHDVERLADADFYVDAITGEYPHEPKSSPANIHSGHLRANAVGRTQLSNAHASQGNITGGYMATVGVVTSPFATFYTDVTSTYPVVSFVTSDGTGDAATPGRFYIAAGSIGGGTTGQTQQTPAFIGPANQSGSSVTTVLVTNGGSGYTSAPLVSFSGGGGVGAAAHANVIGGVVQSVTVDLMGSGYTSAPSVSFSGGGGSGAAATAQLGGYALTFPSSGPADCQIAFCRYFPGSGANGSPSSTGGSLLANSIYYVRFCLYMTITRASTTQTVESPLSPYMELPTGSGSNTWQINFTLPTLPTLAPNLPQWQGFRVYMHGPGEPGGPESGSYYLKLHPNGSTSGPTAITISSYTKGAAIQPSYGFSAWPGGINLAWDGTPVGSFLEQFMMNVGYVAHQADKATNSWPIFMNTGDSMVNGPRLMTDSVGANALAPGAVSGSNTITDKVLTGTSGDGTGVAPTTNPSQTLSTSGASGAWNIGGIKTSTWNLTVAQYNAIMAAGANIRVQFKESSNNSVWSNIISTGPAGGVYNPSPRGINVVFCDHGMGGGGGIVTDITVNFNGGSPQLVVTWQGVNADSVSSRTISIFAKAVGLSPS